LCFGQNDRGTEFFAILDGSVDILVNGDPVGQMVAGQCFGDKALTETGSLRTATIIASAEQYGQVRSTLPSGLLGERRKSISTAPIPHLVRGSV
jgi:hypothetical protein